MYILKAEGSFDAAHFLKGYEGKCANIHGHRWKVEVQIKGEELQEKGTKRGMLVDFGDLKKDTKTLMDKFDHTLIYETNSLKETTVKVLEEEGFALVEVGFRPTAENFAKYFYEELRTKRYLVHQITVYETPDNCAIYTEEA